MALEMRATVGKTVLIPSFIAERKHVNPAQAVVLDPASPAPIG
jgi:hypothetical protein